MDYFNLSNVTLVGLSVGGWLCLRAAAFESRITRVIASGHANHYMDIPTVLIGWIFEFFINSGIVGIFSSSIFPQDILVR